MKSSVICITGIDTNIGKTVVTGLLGRYLLGRGEQVITQKIVQTGCHGMSEDILEHRRVMGLDIQAVDREGLTCPYVFSKPCSPHLAASLAGEEINCRRIDRATQMLLEIYNRVLLEGVGGLLVPLTRDKNLIDYLQEKQYPLIVVGSSRLGSINHTLSALELIRSYSLSLLGIIYNCYPAADQEIEEDSRKLFEEKLVHYGFPATVVDCHRLHDYEDGTRAIDFSPFFL